MKSVRFYLLICILKFRSAFSHGLPSQ